MFTDFKVWKEARNLTAEIYRVTQVFPKQEMYGLTSQMRRAAVSVMANIAEGAGRNSRGEFLQFLSFASGSANEMICHVIIASDIGYLDENKAAIFTSRYKGLRFGIHALAESLKKKS
ncbi:MAG: four helix bundle protein [Patescibacteria group bacterium]